MNRLNWKRVFEDEEGAQTLEIVMVLAIAAICAGAVITIGQEIQKWGERIIRSALNS